MKLKGKLIIVTGATGGIGRELVKVLDTENAKLVLIAKEEKKLKNILKTLRGQENSYFVSDFSKQEDVIRLSGAIKTKCKSIDILINLAGIGVYKPLETVTLEDWNNSLNVGLNAPFILIKELIKLLGKNTDSLVLNIGSGMGVIPTAGRSVYCSTKFGLRGLTLSLAEEYRGVKPSFCLITLGSTLTSFGPMSLKEKMEEQFKGKAYFTPEWVAKKLIEIIKDDKRETEYTIYPGDYDLGWWKKPQ
ncbi:MAG: SDR family oxidoreductase [Veillonellaceae bacterium]|nr:SDR family oxidoreductase [Veillonellaceae bacterium]